MAKNIGRNTTIYDSTTGADVSLNTSTYTSLFPPNTGRIGYKISNDSSHDILVQENGGSFLVFKRSLYESKQDNIFIGEILAKSVTGSPTIKSNGRIMPIYQETTFHDRQCVIDEDTVNTTSNVLEDIPGATLTTNDLSVPGVYLIWFSVLVFSSQNNTNASFSLLVDASASGMDRSIFLKVKDQDIGYTFLGCVEAESGSVLQFQWATSQGTLTLSEYNIIIDGVSKSRIIV